MDLLPSPSKLWKGRVYVLDQMSQKASLWILSILVIKGAKSQSGKLRQDRNAEKEHREGRNQSLHTRVRIPEHLTFAVRIVYTEMIIFLYVDISNKNVKTANEPA